jgi:serine/threonine-protein kinase
MARARLWNYDRDGTDRTAEQARELAGRALAIAPHLGEPWLALGTLEHIGSHWPASVRALRTAIRNAPGLVRAHELLGAIQLEVGAVDDGIRHLEHALSLDGSSSYARSELTRIHALFGRWETVEAIFADPREEGTNASIRAYGAARFSLWRGRTFLFVDGPIADQNFRSGVDAYKRALAGDPTLSFDFLEALANGAPVGSRFRPVLYQHVAELSAQLGQHERALGAVEKAAEALLFDLVWLDRCPVLEPLRGSPRFVAARQVVAARADEVILALR